MTSHARSGLPGPSRCISVRPIPFLVLLGLLAAACAPRRPPQGDGLTGPLVVYSGRREALIQPLVDRFTQTHPEVEVIVKSGDNVELANALLEEAARPQADVFLATEVLTVERLFQEGALEPYASPNAGTIPAAYRQPDAGWTPLTLRARVIMYNTDQITPNEAPASILDLTDPAWEGRVAAAGSTNGSLQA
ncbi:MAG: extracellular solute-binding protein, partial [Anaerolineales bacterium]